MSRMPLIDCWSFVGSTPKSFDGEKRYISTGALDRDHVNEADVEMITFESRPSRANLEVAEGDVLFAKMASTEKTFVVDSAAANDIYSTGFCAVRARESKILPKCLYYFLSSSLFLEQKDKNSSGATQKAITNSGLSKIYINLPDLSEQQEFITQMDLLCSLITARREQLAKLDELVKSRFIEMFGDPKYNPKGYAKQQLKETCRVITGNTPSRAVSEYYGDDIEWIKTDNIVEGILYPTTATESLSQKGMEVGRTVGKDSILMACIAGSLSSIGRVCVTDRKVAFNQQINAIEPIKYNTLFLYVMLQLSKEYLIEEINMALKGILSKSKLEEKIFIVPPMDLQQQFAAFVKQTDKSKFEIQQSLEKLETLKKALMQKYFG